MTKRYKCPCCAYHTIDEPASYDICPICNWEDDGTTDPEKGSGPNHMTLGRAQENFHKFGDMYEQDSRIRNLPSWYNKRRDIRLAMMKVLSEEDASSETKFEYLLDQYHEALSANIDTLEQLNRAYKAYKDQINSTRVESVINGLLGLVFHCEDMEYAQMQCFSLINSENENVRGVAILCFGHLARIHRELTLDWVMPFVTEALEDRSEVVRGHASAALDDIRQYCIQDKVQNTDGEDNAQKI